MSGTPTTSKMSSVAAGEPTLFDSLARLVPKDLQTAYYRVLAHTRTLSPDDEMLRILEAMGTLALLTRHTPKDTNQPTNGIIIDGYRAGKLVWQSQREALVFLQLVTATAAEPLLLSLERHTSSIDDEVGLRPCVYAVGPHGIIARWRGSALAWPLIDAVESNDGVLYALHRGDSFLLADLTTKTTRIAAYRWNGFGFTGVETPSECEPILCQSSR